MSASSSNRHRGVIGSLEFEWEQSLDEVHLYLSLASLSLLLGGGSSAAGTSTLPWKKIIACDIGANHLKFRIQGSSGAGMKDSSKNKSGLITLIDEELFDTVVIDDSFWVLADKVEIDITLHKMRKASTWESVFKMSEKKGASKLDAMAIMEDQKKMTLERFQEEHPGFDFSQAEFNGTPPDPRKFMDGVKY